MNDFIRNIFEASLPPVQANTVRLLGLENTIMEAKPDYCEAAESILAPMMAALERRYDWPEKKSYQALADVKVAYGKLFDALIAAYQVEES